MSNLEDREWCGVCFESLPCSHHQKSQRNTCQTCGVYWHSEERTAWGLMNCQGCGETLCSQCARHSGSQRYKMGKHFCPKCAPRGALTTSQALKVCSGELQP